MPIRPQFETEEEWLEHLRSWFAGQALIGMTASPELMQVVTAGSILDGTTFDRMSKHAYRFADAMLAERSRP